MFCFCKVVYFAMDYFFQCSNGTSLDYVDMSTVNVITDIVPELPPFQGAPLPPGKARCQLQGKCKI